MVPVHDHQSEKRSNKIPQFLAENWVLYKHLFPRHLIAIFLTGKLWPLLLMRAEILRLYHDDPTAGHFRVAKTLSKSPNYIIGQIFVTHLFFCYEMPYCDASKSSNLLQDGLMGSFMKINLLFVNVRRFTMFLSSLQKCKSISFGRCKFLCETMLLNLLVIYIKNPMHQYKFQKISIDIIFSVFCLGCSKINLPPQLLHWMKVKLNI